MKKILIIDDDSSILNSLKDLLSLSDFEVEIESDSIKGVKKAPEYMPDLIICDVVMPGLDGLGVLHKLSNNPETQNIPFIFLTAKSDLSDIRRGMELGADDYLVKPFTPSDLLKAVETRLKKRNNLISEIQDSEKLPSQGKILNKDSNLILMSIDKPENIKIGNIVYIEAVEKYSKIYLVEGKKIIIRKLLKEWEAVLPVEQFIRIHRSIIVNLEYIAKIEKWFNNSFKIYLRNVDNPFETSRRYTIKLKAMNNF